MQKRHLRNEFEQQEKKIFEVLQKCKQREKDSK